MTKLQTIIAALEAKSIRHELSTNPDNNSKWIGIMTGKYVWHWFRILSDEDIMFDHSYSQNTGRTKKGISHGLNIYRAIEKKTNVSFY